jgi:hypothetical protein
VQARAYEKRVRPALYNSYVYAGAASSAATEAPAIRGVSVHGNGGDPGQH